MCRATNLKYVNCNKWLVSSQVVIIYIEREIERVLDRYGVNSIWSIPILHHIYQFQLEQFQFNFIYSAGVVGDNCTTWEVSRSQTSWDSSFWHQSNLKHGSSIVANLRSSITFMGTSTSQYWIAWSQYSEEVFLVANFNSNLSIQIPFCFK